MAEVEELEKFRSNLNLIKSMAGDKAEEEFYNLMEKAKTFFGDLHIYMGEFYFEYAKFLLEKMEKNIDLFNAKELPQVNDGLQIVDQANEDDYEDSSEKAEAQNDPNQVNQAGSNLPVISDDAEEGKVGNGEQKEENQNEGEQDDFEICASNLLCAIKIYEDERTRLQDGGETNIYELGEIQKYISRCKSRLGDLYHLNENYMEAVEVYREVIGDEEKKLGHQSNRGLAEIHYMIANSYLYENKEGCEETAITEFIKAVSILVNHLCLLSEEEASVYEIPSMEKIKVNRFPYLNKIADKEEVKQIKEVISCLLDKLEDTFEQISIREQYKHEVEKIKEEKANEVFKEVSPDAPVVKLGTFGNRKKKPEIEKDERQAPAKPTSSIVATEKKEEEKQ